MTDAAGVLQTLADEVTLRVAVHDQAFDGHAAATQVLGTVFDGVLHEIEVTETIPGDPAAVLMFTTRVAEHPGRADGCWCYVPDAAGPSPT